MTRKSFIHAGFGVIGAACSAAGKHPETAVYAVPPLARRADTRRSIDFEGNEKILRYMLRNGVRHVVYGGNAFLYDITLSEYTALLEWASGFAKEASIMPAVGPSFGRAMDQAPILRKHRFASLLVLPNANPRDAAGLETGLREVAEASGHALTLYLKTENGFGEDRDAGLDVVARLVDAGVCVSIKYAVVRKDPRDDAYLSGLLKRVDPKRVVSGIGERPAVVHLRDFKLNGFTTGSGVLAPKLTRSVLEACGRQDYEAAEQARRQFLPLEDLRDQWGPARVLHAAVALSGLTETGPIPPFVSPLSNAQREHLAPVARALRSKNG